MMQSNIYKVEPGTNLRDAVEKAIYTARALKKDVIIEMNHARFVVGPDTGLQGGIDAYLTAQRKLFEEAQKLRQKTK